MKNDKHLIRKLIRESLLGEDNETNDSEETNGSEDKNNRNKKNIKKDYTDVQNSMNKDKDPTAPSQVGVMKAIGIPDDEKGTNRGLFNKKLNQDKNEDGGLYQFSDEELGEIRAKLGK